MTIQRYPLHQPLNILLLLVVVAVALIELAAVVLGVY